MNKWLNSIRSVPILCENGHSPIAEVFILKFLCKTVAINNPYRINRYKRLSLKCGRNKETQSVWTACLLCINVVSFSAAAVWNKISNWNISLETEPLSIHSSLTPSRLLNPITQKYKFGIRVESVTRVFEWMEPEARYIHGISWSWTPCLYRKRKQTIQTGSDGQSIGSRRHDWTVRERIERRTAIETGVAVTCYVRDQQVPVR